MAVVSPYFGGRGFWALILGGSSGIGLATARKLAGAGMNLFILHRDRRKQLPQVEAAFADIRKLGVKCVSLNQDAIAPDQISGILDSLQEHMQGSEKVRLLLHSISKGSLRLLAPYKKQEQPLDDPLYQELNDRFAANWEPSQPLLNRMDMQITLEAMALSLPHWVQAVFDAGLFADDARVLGLTSEGSKKSWRNYAAVSAAKAALEAICRSIALEFAPHGIRCNVIQAGVTDTPSMRMIPGSEELLQHAAMRNPFGRTTRPEDVADVIYLLCQDEAAWINGALIPVDGGEKNQ